MNMQASDYRLIAAKLTESSCYGLMKSSLIFTARPHCSQCRALYWLDHFCPSVRPSVIPSRSGIVSIRMKIRSCGFQHLVGQSL